MASKNIKKLTGNAGDFSGIVLKAAASGHLDAVLHYLKFNPAWLNQEGPHGRTLLWEASFKGRTELVDKLIQLGADVNPIGSYYTPMLVELSALATAKYFGHQDVAELLKENGAVDDLYAACHRGDLKTIEGFLSRAPQLANTPSKDEPFHPRAGWLPIHYAVAGNQMGSLRLLAEYHATFEPEHLPLLIDWADSNREMVKLLRKLAANSKNNSECKSSDSTVQPIQTKSENARKEKVPAIDRPDWMGFPLLVDACRGNHNAPDDPKRVSELLKRGANINITDHKGKTPLHRASQAGFLKIAKCLIEKGASLEISDDTGGTPLFDATFFGRPELVKFLASQGANIQHLNKKGETLLFAAARGNRLETFQFALDLGVDPEHLNSKGKSVRDVILRSRSKTKERKRMLELLKRT